MSGRLSTYTINSSCVIKYLLSFKIKKMLLRHKMYLRNIFFSLCYLETKCIPVTYRIEPEKADASSASALPRMNR